MAAYGPINKTTFTQTKDGSVIRRMPNLVKFREDPDAMLVMALEDYDEVTGKAPKAAIMHRDVVGPKPPVTPRQPPPRKGCWCPWTTRAPSICPTSPSSTASPRSRWSAELGELIFPRPQKRELWQTADQYLSGNVRDKLAVAEKAGPEYARNAEALRAVQPEDVLPGDIDANLGRRGYRRPISRPSPRSCSAGPCPSAT